MIYNAKKGYGLQLIKFDEQYEDCIIYRDSKEAIIELADKILRTFGNQGLMSRLNDMQSHTHYYNADGHYTECELFANKYEIPVYFINMILSDYGMCIRGCENDIPRIGKKNEK